MSYQLYPSDLTDREREYIKCLIPAGKTGGRKRQRGVNPGKLIYGRKRHILVDRHASPR